MQSETSPDILWQLLESRDLAIEMARVQQRQLSAEVAHLQMQLQELNQHVTQVQADSDARLAVIHQQHAVVESQTVQIQELQQQISELQTRLSDLQTRCQTTELTRARLIQEMRQANESLKHQIQHLHNVQQQQLHEVQQQVSQVQQRKKEQAQKLRKQVNELKSQNQEFESFIRQLQAELESRSTGKAALRQLIKTLLRKLGLFNLVYSRHGAFVPLYNFFFRDAWKPATIAAAQQTSTAEKTVSPASQERDRVQRDETQSAAEPESTTQSLAALTHSRLTNSTDPHLAKAISSNRALGGQLRDVEIWEVPNIDMEAPLIEAVVMARYLGLDIDSEVGTLMTLSDLIQNIHRVLCIQPTQTLIVLLQLIAKHGAKVVCVECTADQIQELSQYGLKATEQSLGDWMIRTRTMSFLDYDAICFSSQTANRDLQLLQGRLSSKTRVIFSETSKPDDPN